jgi:uncharacterized OB-fold protein
MTQSGTGPPRRLLPDASRPGDDGGLLLVAARCGSCGRLSFPPPEYCPHCLGADTVPEDLPAVGRLVASSVVRIPEPGIPAPYAVGVVDLGETRTTGRLADLDLAPGDPVRPVPGVLRDTEPPLLGWLFARAS